MTTLDILMITYRAPEYVQLSLPSLLAGCDDSMNVWLWHNGDHAETLRVVRQHADHPRVARFHHSPENVGLTGPTNWLWENSRAPYVSKVDDDCLLQPGWAQTLVAAHNDHPGFGAIGAWRFQPEDYDPILAEPKMGSFPGGHTLLQNFWVQGSGYVLRRACIERHGALRDGQTFTQYCVGLACAGWVNGWYVPFIREDHMDDPRSPNTRVVDDETLQSRLPLSAQRQGVTTVAAWEASIRRSAHESQLAPLDPAYFRGWRLRRRRLGRRIGAMTGRGRAW